MPRSVLATDETLESSLVYVVAKPTISFSDGTFSVVTGKVIWEKVMVEVD